MPLFRSSTSSAPVQPRSWMRRHKFIAAAVVVVVVAAGLAVWQPWKPCGPGLHPSEGECVGLNLEHTSFGEHDVVEDLGKRVSDHNKQVTGADPNFVTLVLLDNMTPDPNAGSIDETNVRHSVEGALTAVSRANEKNVAHGDRPKVKLQLANYGNNAEQQATAVEEIIAARESSRIIAVVGLGQSLGTTQSAAGSLSDAGIAVISGMASADNMNQHAPPRGGEIENFFRITPTNVDAAKAAANFALKQDYENVLLVQDTNPNDIYSSTLATAFRDAYREKFGRDVAGVERFESRGGVQDPGREGYMKGMLADANERVCRNRPDLVYFAGRGVDLWPFLETLSEDDPCGGMAKVDVLTSDDASNIVHRPLPISSSRQVNVFYTSVATGGQWDEVGPNLAHYRDSYNNFESDFGALGFNVEADLVDGYAMSTHDAAIVAIEAARKMPVSKPYMGDVAAWIKKFRCSEPKMGATGSIAYVDDPALQGNPVDKAMPIMRLNPNGYPEQESLVWPSPVAFDPKTCG